MLLVLIFFHFYLTMNTVYLLYIFGETDVGLLFCQPRNKIYLRHTHLFSANSGVAGVFLPLTEK